MIPKEIKLNSNIQKEIFESFNFKEPLNIIKIPSAINIVSRNLILEIPEDEMSEEEKDLDSKHEYKIGNYLVKYTLGQGTFGKVKLGIYLPNQEKVAIKILEKDRIVEKDDEIRVKREFDMLSQFSHLNVILVAEIFESEDSYYSVMEYCEGGELFNYIVKKNRLHEEESAFFFYQLINGLEYIHSLGIVHRDLKPENLLLTDDHILKIIDFGLSNYFQTGQKNLLTTPCGSPCYASPEMVAGKKYDGFKIDVWSCGIILYAMLCGYLPFEDPDNEVLFKKILECKLEFPSYVNQLSIDLIGKILVTDPEKRITIKEIKEHPFYLKGKEIFEEEFGINQIVRNPIEKNMSNKNISGKNENKENKENEENKENINIMNINKKDKSPSINIKEKEEDNVIDIEIGNKNDEKKDNLKDEKVNERNNDTINNKNDSVDKDINKENEKKKKNRNNVRKNKEDIEKNKKIEGNNRENKDKNVNYNEKKRNKLNIKINLDNKTDTDKKENQDNLYNLNIIHTEQEEIYKPLYKQNTNDITHKFNTIENAKEKKENQKEIAKKLSGILNENNLKKYFELKPEEKSVEKEKIKIKENIHHIPKNLSKEKEIGENNICKERKTEKINILEKIKDLNHNKGDDINQNKMPITPKKIFFISKNIKSQRPSKIKNISKKMHLNMKINPRKYLQQKNRKMEKIISAKEPEKIKSTFAYKTRQLNNKITKYTQSQLKGILNTFNSSQNFNNGNKENNFKHLRIEKLPNKKKNILDKNSVMNNTNNAIKNSITFNIKDIINNEMKNRIKKPELNSNIYKELRNKKIINDTKRIKSTTFTEGNSFINNNKSYSINTNEKLKKKYRVFNRQNEIIFGTNNFKNFKDPYEININDNNRMNYININNDLNTIKTEPSQENYLKYKSLHKGEYKPSQTMKSIRKTKTNAGTLEYNNKSSNNRRFDLTNRHTYLQYISGLRKLPTYNTLKITGLKPIAASDILRNNNKMVLKDRKNNYLTTNKNDNSVKTKKNQQVTIRNTVINFNMIDTGIILPMKKIKNEKKINNTYNTNISLPSKLNKKQIRETTNDIGNYTTLNTIDNIRSLNTINNEIRYNNAMNKFSHLNNNYSKPLISYTNNSNNRNTYINTNNQNKKKNSVTTFSKLVNTMKNNQKYNKIQFNNFDKNTNYLNEKIHNKYQSMKFNDYFQKKNIKRKNIEISGINNKSNNISNNLLNNNTIGSTSNKLSSLIKESNLTLPNLITKNRKDMITKGNGYSMNQSTKFGRVLSSYKETNNSLGNLKNNINENYKIF